SGRNRRRPGDRVDTVSRQAVDPHDGGRTHDGGAMPPVIPGVEGLEPIGSGGFATVYRGNQPKHDRVVAVKVLSVSHVDSATRRRYEREAAAMGNLSSK